jgi:hypothetical protein
LKLIFVKNSVKDSYNSIWAKNFSVFAENFSVFAENSSVFAKNFSVFADSVIVFAENATSQCMLGGAMWCYVGFNSLKSLNLTNVYPNNKNKNNKVKSKPIWPVHLVWMTARLQQDTFLSWHLAPASEVAGGHTLPF